MKYYLIEISEGDSKIAGRAIYEYDDLDTAIANFHSKMGAAMKSDLYTSEQLLVINSENGVHRDEKWTKPVTPPEPEPDPDPEPEENNEEVITPPVNG